MWRGGAPPPRHALLGVSGGRGRGPSLPLEPRPPEPRGGPPSLSQRGWDLGSTPGLFLRVPPGTGSLLFPMGLGFGHASGGLHLVCRGVLPRGAFTPQGSTFHLSSAGGREVGLPAPFYCMVPHRFATLHAKRSLSHSIPVLARNEVYILWFHMGLQLSMRSEVHPTPPLSQHETRSIIVWFHIGLQLSM